MAREFLRASTQYATYGGAVVTGPPFTMACWFNVTNVTEAHWLMVIGDNTTDGDHYNLRARGNVSGDPVQADGFVYPSTDGIASTTTGFSANTWHHACGVFVSDSSRIAYLDGGGKGTNSQSVAPSGIDQTSVGVRTPADDFYRIDGRIAEALIYATALPDAAVKWLASGFGPFSPQMRAYLPYLVTSWPLHGMGGEEPDLAWGNKYPLTLVNGPAPAQHPPLFLPPRSPTPLFASVATAPTLSTVQLTWQDNSAAESGYSIERSSTSATSGFSEIDTVAADTTQYDDQDLSAGTYWYRVRAFDAGGVYSDYSEVAEVTVS